MKMIVPAMLLLLFVGIASAMPTYADYSKIHQPHVNRQQVACLDALQPIFTRWSLPDRALLAPLNQNDAINALPALLVCSRIIIKILRLFKSIQSPINAASSLFHEMRHFPTHKERSNICLFEPRRGPVPDDALQLDHANGQLVSVLSAMANCRLGRRRLRRILRENFVGFTVNFARPVCSTSRIRLDQGTVFETDSIQVSPDVPCSVVSLPRWLLARNFLGTRKTNYGQCIIWPNIIAKALCEWLDKTGYYSGHGITLCYLAIKQSVPRFSKGYAKTGPAVPSHFLMSILMGEPAVVLKVSRLSLENIAFATSAAREYPIVATTRITTKTNTVLYMLRQCKLVPAHSYTIIGVSDGKIRVRNPWDKPALFYVPHNPYVDLTMLEFSESFSMIVMPLKLAERTFKTSEAMTRAQV